MNLIPEMRAAVNAKLGFQGVSSWGLGAESAHGRLRSKLDLPEADVASQGQGHPSQD